MSDDPNHFGPPGGPPAGPPQSGGADAFGQPAQPQPGAYGGPPEGYGTPQTGGYGGPAQAQGGYGAGGPGGGGGGYGGGGPPGGVPYGAPPSGGGGGQPQGWKIASIVLLIVGPVLTLIGLIPCLGILNWLAAPTDVALAVVGTLGLTIGPKMPDGTAAHFPLHLSAVIVGVVLALISIARCTMGSGLV